MDGKLLLRLEIWHINVNIGITSDMSRPTFSASGNKLYVAAGADACAHMLHIVSTELMHFVCAMCVRQGDSPSIAIV